MESGVYLLYNCLYHGLRWCGQLSLVQRTVALQLSRAGEPGVAELADVRPEGCVGLEVLLEDCLVWQLDSADVTGDGLVCRTGATGLSDLRELSEEEVERLITIVQNPRQYKIPDWFLNR